MPGSSQLGFGAGFSTGLANALMAKRQERLQKEEKQSRMAQQFIELGIHSGQFGGIDEIPEPLLNMAYQLDQGAGGKGAKDKQILLRNTLHSAIQGVPGMPLMPGPAASQPSAPTPSGGQQGPLPVNLGASQPGGALDTGAPEQAPQTLASRPLSIQPGPATVNRPLIHIGGQSFSVPSHQEVAQHQLDQSIAGTEQNITAKIGLARRILPVLQQADPKANLDDALAAVGIKAPTTHPFTPVAIGRPLAAADVPADAVDEQGRPIDKTTAPYWQPIRGTTGAVHYQPGAQPTAAGGAAGLGSRNDYVRQWAVDNGLDPKNLSTSDRDKAMKAYVSASSSAGETEAAKQKRGEDIADAIISGEQPPELTRLAGLSGYVRDSLAKKGYDLTQATQDWMATQRYLATLNGPAQTRLRQSVEFVKESVPLVQSLSEDLDKVVDKTKYPLLNKGVMLAAKQGVLGPQARDAATNLDNQINELHTELAVMFRGGGSSTNEALQRADTLLQSNWDTKQLKTALDLIQKNATIRLNSISSIGPSGTSAGNVYAPEGSTTPAPSKAGGSTTTPKTGAQPPAPEGMEWRDGKLFIKQ